MENKYTATLYYFGGGLRGIFTTTQLLEEAGRLTDTAPFTDVVTAKKSSQMNFVSLLEMCNDWNFHSPRMTIQEM